MNNSIYMLDEIFLILSMTYAVLAFPLGVPWKARSIDMLGW